MNSAGLDEQAPEIGVGILKRDELLAESNDGRIRVLHGQLEEVLYAVLALGAVLRAVEVDVDGKLELAVAVLANAVWRYRAYATWLFECLVQIEDHFGHEFVQVLTFVGWAQEQVPFVEELADRLF